MKNLFLVCVVAVLIHTGHCQINCHQCRSIAGLNCLDPYDGPNMVGTYSGGCSNTHTHCYKFKTITRLFNSGVMTGKPKETQTMTRGCIRATGEGSCELNCHQCNSLVDPFCVDPYDGPGMEDDYSDGCDDTDTHCLKYKTISRLYDSGFITGKPRETTTISRGCIRATGEPDGCIYVEGASGFRFECICSKENCNGALGKVVSLVTLVTGFFFTIALRRIIL